MAAMVGRGVWKGVVWAWVFAAAAGVAWPAWAEPDRAQVELDEKLGRELAAESPEAAAAFARGNELRDKKDFDGAADAYTEAARLAPRSSHPLRRLCTTNVQRGREGVSQCRQALAKDDLPMNHTALAAALLASNGDAHVGEAARAAAIAFERDTTDTFTASVYCQAALRNKDLHGLKRGAERLRRLAPNDAGTHYLSTIAAASDGDWNAAEESLAAARAAGFPAEEADRLEAMMRDQQPPYRRYWAPLRSFGIGWTATLLLLLAGGFLLSQAALRSAARLPAEPTGHVRGPDALVRGAYKGLLWIACAFYYASIPLILAVIVAATGAIIYGFFALGQIPVKLLALLVFGAGWTMLAILRSLFVRAKDSDPGTSIDVDDHPRLRAVLHEVAGKVGTRPVDRVFITPGTDVAVLERGSALARLRNGKLERCLVLGVGALQGMRLLDFKAILAHEYGHFQNEDTAGGGFALAVRRSLLISAMAMAQSGVATWYNPAWWFVRGFYMLFLRISQGASRLQEVMADRWAAFSYGARAFESGLRHVIAASVRFDAQSTAVLNEVVEKKRGLRNLYTYEPEEKPNQGEIESAIEEALSREASPYDSHPAPAERFALVHKLRAPEPEDDDSEALDLFGDRDALQRQMTNEVRERVADQTGIHIADEVAAPKKKKRKKAAAATEKQSVEGDEEPVVEEQAP